MKLLIIILNYKVTHLVLECLDSLKSEVAAIAGVRVTVVENGSGPTDAAVIQQKIDKHKWHSWVDVLPLPNNIGFTGGNNVVMRKALTSPDPPEYVLLLNADTVVLPHAISKLLSFMEEHPQAGIAGSCLISSNGAPQSSPFRFHNLASEFDRGLGLGLVSRLLRRWLTPLSKPEAPQAVDWVAGASMIVRREVFEQIGLLDESYFAYFEDMDFCLNANRAGWPTWYVPASRVVHHEGSSSGIGLKVERRRPAYWFQARRHFFTKNHGRVYSTLADIAFIAGSLLGHGIRICRSKQNWHPPHMLRDSIRHGIGRGYFVKPSANQ